MAAYQNEWVKRVWQATIEAFGSACLHCGKSLNLEFAHTEPTGLCGRGRGKYRRLRDVRRNPDKYILLCMTCHDLFDGRTVRHRQTEFYYGGSDGRDR